MNTAASVQPATSLKTATPVRTVVPARAAWSSVLRAGETLTLTDLHGNQAVGFDPTAVEITITGARA